MKYYCGLDISLKKTAINQNVTSSVKAQRRPDLPIAIGTRREGCAPCAVGYTKEKSETVSKMCRFSLLRGYTHTKPVTKPKLGALLSVIDAILEVDHAGSVKQRHTASGSSSGCVTNMAMAVSYTVVKDYDRCDQPRVDVDNHALRCIRKATRRN